MPGDIVVSIHATVTAIETDQGCRAPAFLEVTGTAPPGPVDFAFRLTREEHEALRSQIAISKTGRRGGRRYLPYAFTEHGAVMAASVLNSPRAIEMSVEVVRAFVRLRALVTSHHQLAAKLGELEKKVASHDKSIVTLFGAVRSLMAVPEKPKRLIGF